MDHERLRASALDNWEVELCGLLESAIKSPSREHTQSALSVPRLPPPPAAGNTVGHSANNSIFPPPADPAQSIVDDIFNLQFESGGNTLSNGSSANSPPSNTGNKSAVDETSFLTF